jgi:hypothetical protein
MARHGASSGQIRLDTAGHGSKASVSPAAPITESPNSEIEKYEEDYGFPCPNQARHSRK